MSFQAYDVRLAEEFGLQAEAEKAQGEFMKRRQVILQRQIQSKIEKAKQRVEERKAQVRQQSAQKKTA